MKSKKLIIFARVEPTRKAILENVSGDWNKKIVFYVTDGKKIAKINEESYTNAKVKFYESRMIFLGEKEIEIPRTVLQDVGVLKLFR